MSRNFEGIFGLIVFVCTGRKRQRIGDLLAKTIVVDAREHPVTRELTMQHLGYPAIWLAPALIVFALNVQGRGPGSYQAEVNRICTEADKIIAADPFSVADVLSQEVTFLDRVDAPLNWEDRHDALVREYQALADESVAVVQRVTRSKRPKVAFSRGFAKLLASGQASNTRLAALGYTGCAGTES